MRLLTIVLLALLASVHYELWFGRFGLDRLEDLQVRLEAQERKNAQARERNERLAAEVRDLKDGLEMVEEKARYELGMVRPDEVYVHVMPPPSSSPTQ